MVHEFKSKVGWWYHLILVIMAVICIITFVGSQSRAMLICSLIAMMLLVYFMINTWYRITDDELIAHCGFLPEKRIKIADIDKIGFSHMPISTYALSLDRIVIFKQGKIWLLISPKRQDEFVKVLRTLNENIHIDRSTIL